MVGGRVERAGKEQGEGQWQKKIKKATRTKRNKTLIEGQTKSGRERTMRRAVVGEEEGEEQW